MGHEVQLLGRLSRVMSYRDTASVTYPEQPAFSYELPAQPKKSYKQLLLGIAAGGAAGLVLGCCGGFAIGTNSDKDSRRSAMVAASPSTSAPTTPVAEPTTPVAEPTTPSAEPTTAPAPPATTAPAGLVMPNVVGQNAAVAADQLRKAGFTDIQYGSQDENNTVVLLPANWTVAKQSAKAGSRVPADTLIVLTCTKGA